MLPALSLNFFDWTHFILSYLILSHLIYFDLFYYSLLSFSVIFNYLDSSSFIELNKTECIFNWLFNVIEAVFPAFHYYLIHFTALLFFLFLNFWLFPFLIIFFFCCCVNISCDTFNHFILFNYILLNIIFLKKIDYCRPKIKFSNFFSCCT